MWQMRSPLAVYLWLGAITLALVASCRSGSETHQDASIVDGGDAAVDGGDSGDGGRDGSSADSGDGGDGGDGGGGDGGDASIPRIEPPASFDEALEEVLERWDIPGMALSVTYEGRLIFARGYGLADVEAGEGAHARSLFRLASISKPVTAVAILTLVEEGLVDLDAPAFSYLDHLPPPPGSTPDSRIGDIRVRDLLQHSSGWSFEGYPTGDPLTEVPESVREVAATMGVPSPADPDTLVRYLRGHVPLANAPRTTYGYANVNYVVLSRIIEAVTGQAYEDYVRASVLAPMGVRAMAVGDSRLENRLEGEVRYYDAPGAELVTSVFDGVTEPVPWPYGGWDLRAMDGAAGWVADVVDLARFVLSFDGEPEYPDTLSADTVEAMMERPPGLHGEDWWYGLGLVVAPSTGGEWVQHSGALQGNSTIFLRIPEGYVFTMFFNSHPEYPSRGETDFHRAQHLLDTIAAFREFGETIPGFLDQDLFPLYP